MFSETDRATIRERAEHNPKYIEKIENETADVRRKLYIQKTGLATWYHYFTCPECGTRLRFDYDDNEKFFCPECGKAQTGEPYLGAWWETVLTLTTSAAYKLAIGYIATGREDFLSVAKKIILGYAENYKNYEVHGGIPYNHPGRFASQVLSDCDPICNLAPAYSLIKSVFTDRERTLIENELFRHAAEHQKKYLTPQLHNHEVAICTSIAVIGLAIDDAELVRFATDTKYGLKYQIDHAYLEDNMWFECSASYHLYALKWFMTFEKMAKNTEHSLFRDPHYREKLYKALILPLKLRVNDSNTARINDGHGSLRGYQHIYEHAYSCFGTDEILELLYASYGVGKRESFDALIYGVDSLPARPEIPLENYISECGSGLAILHAAEGRTLIFKATPYGGEHDHYDRLAISFDAFGKGACTDFGTASGYGSPLHYGYFKNTSAHNTVVIDGENMAPCDTRVREYSIRALDDIYLDAETMSPEEYEMLDSFTIKQWSDEAYKGVRMRRIISWHDKYFIDVFSVKTDNELKKEWTWHINAEAEIPEGARYIGKVSDKGAEAYLSDAYSYRCDRPIKLTYCAEDWYMDVYTSAEGRELIFAKGPNNPATTSVSYLLERTAEKSPIFINVIEAYKSDSVISSVEICSTDGRIEVTVTEKSGKVRRLKIKL